MNKFPTANVIQDIAIELVLEEASIEKGIALAKQYWTQHLGKEEKRYAYV